MLLCIATADFFASFRDIVRIPARHAGTAFDDYGTYSSNIDGCQQISKAE
jgi:hypothetical protein